VHEDVEDPATQTAPATSSHLQMFERYGMAWIRYWAARDCTVAGYLNGPSALADQGAGLISVLPGALAPPACA
jgi:hypothetical protein